MALTDYLTSHYLTASTASNPTTAPPSKKRKRKHPQSSGLAIQDDTISGFTAVNGDEDDENTPMMSQTRTAEFRRRKASSFKPVTDAQSTQSKTTENTDSADADAILSQAAAQRAAHAGEPDDEAPTMVDSEPAMSSGARAGLQTAEEMTKAMKRREKEERRQARQAAIDAGTDAKQTETIYRDASGRIVNISKARAEARQKEEDEERIKREKREAALGDVQRAQKAQRADELYEAKIMPVARYADDEALNVELREKERWNDPAAGFIAKKKEGKSVSGRPLYKGAAEPNRYGIRPGHRWDGVDRGNGTERRRFAAANRRRDVKELKFQWEMDE